MSPLEASVGPSTSPDRFDPAEWAAIQEGTGNAPAGFLFRRGRELAGDTILARSANAVVDKWLDLGCGPGHLMRDLATRRARIVGADHDPAMLRFARQVVLRDLGGALVGADATRLPFAEASFDGVAAISLLGCVADPIGVLREVARVLRIGGTLVTTITSRSSVLRRMEAVASRLTRRRNSAAAAFRAYSIDEAAHLLGSAGLTVEYACGYGFHLEARARVLPGETASRALERSLPCRLGVRLARNVLFVARRG